MERVKEAPICSILAAEAQRTQRIFLFVSIDFPPRPLRLCGK